jgi:hypothetical protein
MQLRCQTEVLFMLRSQNQFVWFSQMNVSDEFKIDPLTYAAGLESPVGVYLRREIFKQETRSDSSLRKRLYQQQREP